MKNRAPHNKRERGIMLVMFAITVPSLLGLSALALDAGNLYLTRLRLDKAVREVSGTALSMVALQGWSGLVQQEGAASGACVVNGANLCGSLSAKSATADHPSTGGPATQQILNAMKNAATRALGFPECGNIGGDNDDSDGAGDDNTGNQKCRFYSGNTPTGTGFGTDAITLSGQTSVNVRIEYDTPTLLAGAMGEILDGFGAGCIDGRCTVSSTPITQSGNLRRANLFLLLDTSGSMSDTASDGSTLSKKDILTEAASYFIDMFNPSKDRVAIIQYSTAAKTIRNLGTFEQAGTSENTLQVKEAIATLQASGMTNPCDALLATINSLPADTSEPTFVVLFTDGAPNVYRMNFCHDNGNCKSNPPNLTTTSNTTGLDSNFGWYGWTVNWGERETYCTENTTDPDTGNDCDPFFSYPKVLRGDGEYIPLVEAKDKININSSGQFELTGSTGEKLTLTFKEKVIPNYKDFGPSYLVHASERDKLLDPDITLIDRIPSNKNDGTSISEPVTCGPGSRGAYRGADLSLDNNDGKIPDNFNHSRYFASRVLDASWHPNTAHPDFSPSTKRRDLLDFDKFKDPTGRADSKGNTRIAAPPYFPLTDAGRTPYLPYSSSQSPGCVTNLSGFLPNSIEHKIFLGKNFVSNNSPKSIKRVGEIVKSAELPYYCAIRAADALRSRNVRIFTIGLGTPASSLYDTNQTPCNDPLENALDFNSRKDKFLTRLALDPRALADPKSAYKSGTISSNWNSANSFAYKPEHTIQCRNHPLNGETITIGYGEAGTPNNPISQNPAGQNLTRNQLGTYYGSNDPSQLKGIFAQVAKQILLELSL